MEDLPKSRPGDHCHDHTQYLHASFPVGRNIENFITRPIGTKFTLGGGLKRGAREVMKKGGPPFRSLENTLFLENLPLTEAKDHV